MVYSFSIVNISVVEIFRRERSDGRPHHKRE